MIIIFLLFLILAIIAFAINRAIISGKLKKNLDEITRQNAINSGMNGHIAKPIDVNILFETMRDLT